MKEIDLGDLEAVREWAQRRVDYRERQKRMKPLFNAVQANSRALTSDVFPSLMAGPAAEVRRSVLALEKSLAEWPQKSDEAEAKRQANLARVRRRTAALQAWLDAVS